MNNWDDFCKWLIEDMGLGNLPIEWQVIKLAPPKTGPVDPFVGEGMVRIDIFPDKPYKVSVGIPNTAIYMNHEMSYYIARYLMFVIRDAIESKSPMCYIPYTQFKFPTV